MEEIRVPDSKHSCVGPPPTRLGNPAYLVWILPIILCMTLNGKSFPHISQTPGSSVHPDSDADTFVRDVLHNEVEAETHDQSLWSYRERKMEHGKEELLSVCQTKEGQIERLVAMDDKPLASKEVQAEDQRIHNLIAHPRRMRQEQRKQREDGEQARSLLKILPEAFLFQYDSTEGSLVRLKFTPNPKFHPSTHAEQVFHHMEGTLLLDGRARRLVAISGALTSEVEFGGGLLGHLDKGGTFIVQQQEVSPGYWEITLMHVQMKGRVLFFKSIAVQDDETYSDFRLVPENTSLQRAAEILQSLEFQEPARIVRRP
jgi:hypothetical protein